MRLIKFADNGSQLYAVAENTAHTLNVYQNYEYRKIIKREPAQQWHIRCCLR